MVYLHFSVILGKKTRKDKINLRKVKTNKKKNSQTEGMEQFPGLFSVLYICYVTGLRGKQQKRISEYE